MFTNLRADVPTARPAAVKIIADVTPRASSGLETAPYKMRITAMVIRATIMRPPLASVTVARRDSSSHTVVDVVLPDLRQHAVSRQSLRRRSGVV
jgi:hypothetical protein